MFDAHCHLHFDAFDPDRAGVIYRAQAAGLRGLVMAGYDHQRRPLALELAVAYPQFLFATAGLHPWALPHESAHEDAWLDQALGRLKDDLQGHDFCALGECGLDYARASSPRARDFHKRACIAQLKLATCLDLPVVLHIVKAYHDLLWCLDQAPGARGMIHSYSGPIELIKPLVARGWSLSFGTDLVRHAHGKVHHALSTVAQQFPEHWMLETDSPDRPVMEGSRGEPADLVCVLKHAAALLEAPPREIANQTEDNARRVLGLPQRKQAQ